MIAIVFPNRYWEETLQDLRAVLVPAIKVLRLGDGGDDKEVMGKVYAAMAGLLEETKRRGIEYKAEAVKIIEGRWAYLHNDLHAAAYALDPEFNQFIAEHDAATTAGLHNTIEKLCYVDVIKELVAEKKPADPAAFRALFKPILMTDARVQERIVTAMSEFSAYERKEGAFSKSYVFECAKKMKPSAWWSMFGKHVPVISPIARRVLPQPVCAAGAERNWPIYGQIKTKGRSRLSHSTADKMVFAHETLRLLEKRQTAHYRPPVATWHESSDEETDEEDLIN